MNDKRMELLTLLGPGEKHAAETRRLAADLGVSRCDIERLVGQLQALGFHVVSRQNRAWINWSGWPRARRAAEAHLANHPH